MKIKIVPNIPISKEGQDLTSHGSIEFPLAVHYTVLSQNILGYVDWHWHDELQLCRVVKGSVRFFVNEKSWLLQKGEGIFINSNLLHQAKPEQTPDSSYYCIDWRKDVLSCMPGSRMESRYVLPYQNNRSLDTVILSLDTAWQKEILDCIERIVSLVEEESFGYEYSVYSRIFEIWLALISHQQADTKNSTRNLAHQATVRAIFSFIHAHYAEPISAKQIAAEVSFSPEESGRIFKRITGETIWTYLTTYRLSCASVLLKESTHTVSQIAYETGFGSTSYFILKFRERFGITPCQFRKQSK